MPSNDQLNDMLRTKTDNAAERIFDFDTLEGEQLVVGRQFAEMAFLLLDRLPVGARRLQALVALRNARNAAIDALERAARNGG